MLTLLLLLSLELLLLSLLMLLLLLLPFFICAASHRDKWSLYLLSLYYSHCHSLIFAERRQENHFNNGKGKNFIFLGQKNEQAMMSWLTTFFRQAPIFFHHEQKKVMIVTRKVAAVEEASDDNQWQIVFFLVQCSSIK